MRVTQNMGGFRKPGAVCLILLLSTLGLCEPTSADIYRYQDENGVWHFTNIQSDKRYRLYIRTHPKKPSDYIKKYEGVIAQASKAFGVDPYLIKAVIRAESGFDPKAVSRKGAQGLMQLMPDTAEAMDVKDPFNPEENIFGGTRYLSLLLEQYQKNRELALAAYNAGPDKVEKYRGIPPFPETRAFVKRVLEYHETYKKGQ